MKVTSAAVACLLLLAAAPLAAGEVEKNVPFVLDQWIDLAASDGPVTLHRIRIVKQGSGAKSKILRPGNAEFLEDVQIQLEFTNEASKDWEAHVRFVWSDGSGAAIDGYDDTENLDSDSRHDQQTVTLSTLRYGLERAAKLEIRITFEPD
jgi:hypothetical protein